MKKLIKKNNPLVALVTFFILFLISLAIFFPILLNGVSMYRYSTLKYRLEMVKLDEEYLCLQNVAQNYLLQGNHEPEFDKYWEFSTMESAYMQGCTLKRAILEGDHSKQPLFDKCIEIIENYIATQSSPILQNYAKTYLKELLN